MGTSRIAVNLTWFFRVATRLAAYQGMPIHWAHEVLQNVIRCDVIPTWSTALPSNAHPPKPATSKRLQSARKVPVRHAVLELKMLAALAGWPVGHDSQSQSMPRLYQLCALNVRGFQETLMCSNLYISCIGLAIVRMRKVGIKHRLSADDEYSWSDDEEELLSDTSADSARTCPELATQRIIKIREAIAARDARPQVLQADHMSRYEVLHLISSAKYESAERNVTFPMCPETLKALSEAPRIYAVLFEYTSWLSISVPRPLTEAVPVPA